MEHLLLVSLYLSYACRGYTDSIQAVNVSVQNGVNLGGFDEPSNIGEVGVSKEGIRNGKTYIVKKMCTGCTLNFIALDG
jgi:hypothetical protein